VLGLAPAREGLDDNHSSAAAGAWTRQHGLVIRFFRPWRARAAAAALPADSTPRAAPSLSPALQPATAPSRLHLKFPANKLVRIHRATLLRFQAVAKSIARGTLVVPSAAAISCLGAFPLPAAEARCEMVVTGGSKTYLSAQPQSADIRYVSANPCGPPSSNWPGRMTGAARCQSRRDREHGDTQYGAMSPAWLYAPKTISPMTRF